MSEPLVPGAGDVELILPREPKPVILRCTARAALRLSRLPGSLENSDPHVSTVTSRVLGLNIDTMAEVIRAGVGVESGKVPDLEEKIYEAGLYNVMFALARYLGCLKNGGVPIGTAAQEGDAGEGEADPQTRSA